MFWQSNKGPTLETHFYLICYPLFQSYVTAIYVSNHLSHVFLLYFAIQTHLNQFLVVAVILFCEIQFSGSNFGNIVQSECKSTKDKRAHFIVMEIQFSLGSS